MLLTFVCELILIVSVSMMLLPSTASTKMNLRKTARRAGSEMRRRNRSRYAVVHMISDSTF